MWCCGSDGCGLFLMTVAGLLSYCMLYKIQALSQIQNVKIYRNVWCDKNKLGCFLCCGKCCLLGFISVDGSAVSSDSLSAWTCFLPVPFKSETTGIFPPCRVWVWSMIDKENTINQTSSWEASFGWETCLSYPICTFSPFCHVCFGASSWCCFMKW